MGNICGKTEADPFDQPGRVLGSAPPPGPTTAPVPKKVGGPPRVLGGSSTAEASGSQEDARRKASEAALRNRPHPSHGRGLRAPLAGMLDCTHHHANTPTIQHSLIPSKAHTATTIVPTIVNYRELSDHHVPGPSQSLVCGRR
ncbi:hypothetical protein BKA56DRAFT_607447 [Ilyonectria sp. MPI-CAGE-AT-0026]|nr:hypothetical protein BKA56DRAFT_607447 [Ilyonectria sp. MPI-CAGE-AT-0026]